MASSPRTPGSRFEWNARRIDRLLTMWASDETMLTIGKEVGVSRSAVSGQLTKMGLFGEGGRERAAGMLKKGVVTGASKSKDSGGNAVVSKLEPMTKDIARAAIISPELDKCEETKVQEDNPSNVTDARRTSDPLIPSVSPNKENEPETPVANDEVQQQTATTEGNDIMATSRFLDLMRGRNADAPLTRAETTAKIGESLTAKPTAAKSPAVIKAPDAAAVPKSAEAAVPTAAALAPTLAVAPTVIATSVVAEPTVATTTDTAETAAPADDLAPVGHRYARTAAENAAGRDGPTIIKDMLRDSAAIGEPVTLRLPVTKEMADYIMTLNENNRKFAPVKLEQYKDDMLNGRWEENGEGISISIEGSLNNGQHRNRAISETGITQIMSVTVGVTRKSRGTNDIGKIKSGGDHLGMDGHSNPGALNAAARMIIAFKRGSGESLGNPGPVSTALVREEVAADPAIIAAANFGATNAAKIRRYTTPTVLALLKYLTNAIDPVASQQFLNGILTGTENGRGLDIKDARYRARETLFNMIKKNNTPERAEILFRAWNAWRQGRGFENSIQTRGKLPILR